MESKIVSGIRDNHNRGKIGDFLKEKIKPGSKLSFVSAFFTIYAYHHLKDELDKIEELDFLFGEPRFVSSLDPEKTDKKAFKIEDDELQLSNRLQQKKFALDCAEWIREKVNIRSVRKPNFLHGKLYHIDNNGVNEAIVGSSNFTVRGLGLNEQFNIELNLEVDSRRDREDLYEWFHEIWNDETLVEDVKDSVLQYLEQLYQENNPEFIYFKTLFEIFKDYLSEQKRGGLLDERIGFFESDVWNMLYDFQKDGVKGAINKILKHNGCIIADSVGLGKTFEALAVIKYFELLNERVLVLCPKKLRDNWTIFRNNDELNSLLNDRFRFDVLSHTDLSRYSGRSGDIDLSTINWWNYDLLVIDESHNFKNNAKGRRKDDGELIQSRYNRLMNEIIREGINTKVLMLSATPVNTNLRDLRNQIYLITKDEDDALDESIKIKNIAQTIKNAQTQFTLWADPKKNPKRLVKDLLEKLDSSFFKLLDELTIARSRKHIENYYDINKIGKFPERCKPISKAPNIDLADEFPSYDTLNKEIMNYKLSLFNPSAYVKDEWKDHYEEKAGRSVFAFIQETREHFLIGMMKVNFLKRLESSIEAFQISMERTIKKIKELENKIRDFQQEQKSDGTFEIDAFTNEEADEDPENAELQESLQVGKKLKFELKHLNLDLWLKDLKSDKDQLVLLFNTAQSVTVKRDEKLSVLKQLIEEKVKNPINGENKKVIIFTAFADTAYYLYDSIIDWVQNHLGLHIAVVAGGARENLTTYKPKGFRFQSEFDRILTNFSPIAKNRAKMRQMPQDCAIDILIATDCISEGQNLQDCDYLVNYDIHWNPVRIIQRFGRVDRLGSRNKKIQLVNFWPTADLNKYINLKDRVEARMALVDIAASGEETLLNTDQIQGLVLEEMNYRDKQLLRLKEEVIDLEDMDDNVSLSEFTLDDFRIELLNYLESNRKRLEEAPFGLYTVAPTPSGNHAFLRHFSKLDANVKEIIRPGVIFCLKQKGESSGNETVNPLQPYFLVYIRNDGTVRFNYTNPKQILEIFRVLCQGRTEPLELLCDLFNKETQQGQEMTVYSELLKQAIREISSVFKKRSHIALKASRDGKIIPKSKQISDTNDFELISWLIIM